MKLVQVKRDSRSNKKGRKRENARTGAFWKKRDLSDNKVTERREDRHRRDKKRQVRMMNRIAKPERTDGDRTTDVFAV